MAKTLDEYVEAVKATETKAAITTQQLGAYTPSQLLSMAETLWKHCQDLNGQLARLRGGSNPDDQARSQRRVLLFRGAELNHDHLITELHYLVGEGVNKPLKSIADKYDLDLGAMQSMYASMAEIEALFTQALRTKENSTMNATLRADADAPAIAVVVTKVYKRKDGRTVIRVKASGPLQSSLVEAMKLYEQSKPLLADAQTLYNRVDTIYQLIRSYRNELSDEQQKAIDAFERARYGSKLAIERFRQVTDPMRRINDLNKRAANDPEAARRHAGYIDDVESSLNDMRKAIRRGQEELVNAQKNAALGDHYRRLIPEGLNG